MTAGSLVPLRDLLQALAGQMDRLAQSSKGIEEALGQAISQSAPATGPVSASLQGMDNLVQALAGVAAYLESVAEEVDPSLLVDPRRAVASVRQHSLALALSGRGGSTGPTDAGSADFF